MGNSLSGNFEVTEKQTKTNTGNGTSPIQTFVLQNR